MEREISSLENKWFLSLISQGDCKEDMEWESDNAWGKKSPEMKGMNLVLHPVIHTLLSK